MHLLPTLISILVLILGISTLSAATSDAKAILACEATAQIISFTDSESVTLANKLKHCLELTLSQNIKDSLEALKARLSSSLRNAVFLKNACIFSVHVNEYLYSEVEGYRYENETDKRRVFTWVPGTWDHKDRGDWKFVPSGDHFFIVSTHHDEYLFAGVKDDHFGVRRRVYTYEPDFGDDTNRRLGLWSLIPVGDNVYLVNKQYGEYLYANTGNKYDDNRRLVATYVVSGFQGDYECVWSIKPC